MMTVQNETRQCVFTQTEEKRKNTFILLYKALFRLKFHRLVEKELKNILKETNELVKSVEAENLERFKELRAQRKCKAT